MNPYKILFLKDMRTLKNWLTSLMREPKRLVMYIAYMAFMFFIFKVNYNNVNNGSESISMFTSPALSFPIIYALLGLLFSMQIFKNNCFFSLPDVNYVFPAPLDSRKVLLYNLLRKIPGTLLSSFFIIFVSVPFILKGEALNLKNILICVAGFLIFQLLLEPITFCTFAYSARTKNESISKTIAMAITALVVLGGMIPFLLSLASGTGLIDALNTDSISYVPIVGWTAFALKSASANLITNKTLILLSFNFMLYIGLVFTTYFMGTDYYEEIATSSNQIAKKLKLMKSGRNMPQLPILGFRKNKAYSVACKGDGAKALAWKRMLLIKKTDISSYVSLETLIVVAVAVGLGLMLRNENDGYMGCYAIAGLMVYIKFLFSMNTPLDQELKMHYFYLIPDSGAKKIFELSKFDLIKFCINTVAGLLVYTIIIGNITPIVLLLPFAALSFYICIIYSAFMAKLILPDGGDLERLFVLFKMIQNVLIFAPAILAAIGVGIFTQSELLTMISIIIVNGLLASVFLIFSNGILGRIELK